MGGGEQSSGKSGNSVFCSQINSSNVFVSLRSKSPKKKNPTEIRNEKCWNWRGGEIENKDVASNSILRSKSILSFCYSAHVEPFVGHYAISMYCFANKSIDAGWCVLYWLHCGQFFGELITEEILWVILRWFSEMVGEFRRPCPQKVVNFHCCEPNECSFTMAPPPRSVRWNFLFGDGGLIRQRRSTGDVTAQDVAGALFRFHEPMTSPLLPLLWRIPSIHPPII